MQGSSILHCMCMVLQYCIVYAGFFKLHCMCRVLQYCSCGTMYSDGNIFGYSSGSKGTFISSDDLRSDPQWHSLLLPDSLVEVGERQILHDNVQIPSRIHNNSSLTHCTQCHCEAMFQHHTPFLHPHPNTPSLSPSTLTLTPTFTLILPHPNTHPHLHSHPPSP